MLVGEVFARMGLEFQSPIHGSQARGNAEISGFFNSGHGWSITATNNEEYRRYLG